MGLFGTILQKLGFGESAAHAAPQTSPAQESTAPKSMAPPASKEMAAVDVVAKLEGLAAKHKEKLNWKVSIVDLLKLGVIRRDVEEGLTSALKHILGE